MVHVYCSMAFISKRDKRIYYFLFSLCVSKRPLLPVCQSVTKRQSLKFLVLVSVNSHCAVIQYAHVTAETLRTRFAKMRSIFFILWITFCPSIARRIDAIKYHTRYSGLYTSIRQRCRLHRIPECHYISDFLPIMMNYKKGINVSTRVSIS